MKFTMDSQFYETTLPKHKMFNDIKDSLNENPSGKLRNLMELKDDVLYLWNSIENCLMSLNLRHLEDHKEETPYQKLYLVSPPSFAVERVMTSACGSRACVWGTRGVVVAELPSRWGRSGLFESGSHTVLCKSFCLDERFLYSQAEVRRVHWHPTSLSHVLVLVSDNSIRLYNIALKSGPKMVKSFMLGPKPSGALAGRTFLDSLGDTAVDFTPAADSDALLILRGNGDVYMMQCCLDSTSSSGVESRVWGPLAMYPPADDNYGTDSCSVAVVGGRGAPPLVVVATSSAALYHCLLLPNSTDKEEGKDSHALYVVEAVDLDIDLNSGGQDLHYSYPVHLYPCTASTYVCVHAGGAHAISLPMVQHLKDLCTADDADIENAISGICGAGAGARARHLVCTRGAPPAGAALAPPPRPALLLLTEGGTLCIRTLEPFDLEEQLYREIQLKNPALEQDDINKLLKENQKMSFTCIMQEILMRDISQPMLATGAEPAPGACAQVLSEALVRLRGEYLSRQQRARRAAQKKVLALRALAAQQQDWRDLLQTEIEEVQLQSVVLKEKCAVAEKYQDDLKDRCSAVIRSLRSSSGASPAERELLGALGAHARDAERLAERVRAVAEHARRKTTELKRWQEDYKKKDIALGKSHSDTIQSILQEQTSQISTLIEETKLLKDQLGVV